MSGESFDIVLNVRALFPDGQVERDNDGQVIIYTGLYDCVSIKTFGHYVAPNSPRFPDSHEKATT